MKQYLLAIIAVFLGGCVAGNINSDYRLTSNPGKSVVVMSLTYSPHMPLVNLNYRRQGADENIIVASGSISTPVDWKDPSGRLVVLELPTGKYEFFEWGASVPGAGLRSRKNFLIPFVIYEGKVTYIGNIHVDVNYTGPRIDSPGTLRTTYTDQFKITINDMSERDAPLFFGRYKNIANADMVKNIAKLIEQ